MILRGAEILLIKIICSKPYHPNSWGRRWISTTSLSVTNPWSREVGHRSGVRSRPYLTSNRRSITTSNLSTASSVYSEVTLRMDSSMRRTALLSRISQIPSRRKCTGLWRWTYNFPQIWLCPCHYWSLTHFNRLWCLKNTLCIKAHQWFSRSCSWLTPRKIRNINHSHLPFSPSSRIWICTPRERNLYQSEYS